MIFAQMADLPKLTLGAETPREVRHVSTAMEMVPLLATATTKSDRLRLHAEASAQGGWAEEADRLEGEVDEVRILSRRRDEVNLLGKSLHKEYLEFRKAYDADLTTRFRDFCDHIDLKSLLFEHYATRTSADVIPDATTILVFVDDKKSGDCYVHIGWIHFKGKTRTPGWFLKNGFTQFGFGRHMPNLIEIAKQRIEKDKFDVEIREDFDCEASKCVSVRTRSFWPVLKQLDEQILKLKKK